MSTEIYFIKPLKKETLFNSTLIYREVGNKIELKYLLDDFEHTVVDDWPFFALVKLRQKLETINLKILSNGSRYDVYPSGMSAVGVMAYVLVLNKAAKKLVNIFAPADVNKIALVDEQKAFRDKWLRSLGHSV